MYRNYCKLLLILISIAVSCTSMSAIGATEELTTTIEDDIALVMLQGSRAADDVVQQRVSRALLEGDATILLSNYEKSNSRFIRNAAVRKYDYVMSQTQNEIKRRSIVNRLAILATDRDPYVYKQALKSLAKLELSDFTESTRKYLITDIAKNTPNSLKCLLSGVLLDKSQEDILRSYLPNDDKPQTVYTRYGLSWHARLALARMGSESDAQECVRILKSEPNIVLRAGELLDGVAWTRSPQALSLLMEYIENNDCLPSTTGHGKGTPIAYFALDTIVRSLADCPIEYSGQSHAYTMEDLSIVRDWLRNTSKITWLAPSKLGWPK